MNNVTIPQMAFTIMPEDAPEELIKSGALNKYLVLIEGEWIDNEQPYKWFQIVTGRQNAYDYIKELLKDYAKDNEIFIDIEKSMIIADAAVVNENTPRITFDNAYNIYRFMFEMKSRAMIKDDSDFCIDDYKPEREESSDEELE